MEGNLNESQGIEFLKRKQRTEALVEGERSVALSIAEEIHAALPVEILSSPREELVMLKVRESARNSLFYLAEALMCSCRARVSGATGFGYVLGHDLELSKALAVVDGAFNWAETSNDGLDAQLASKFRQWNSRIIQLQDNLRLQVSRRQEAIDATRVEFFAMDGE